MSASEGGSLPGPCTVYDVIVVGAGIVGTSAAYQLQKRGHTVLVLEQFPIPHSRGSSQGQTRSIRRAYFQLHYARMMEEAYESWRELETDSGQTLITKTGMLSIGPSSSRIVKGCQESMEACNAPFEMLSHSQMRTRYPQFKLAPDYIAQLDPEAGIIKAERALLTMQEIYKRKGGLLLDGTRMESVTPGDIATVHTARGTFLGRRVIFTGGAWMKKITANLGLQLPLKPIRTLVSYWKVKNPEAGMFHSSIFPVFVFPDKPAMPNVNAGHFYGIPADEYPGCVKICYHGGPEINPDFRDQTSESWDVDAVRLFVERFMPDIETTPAVVEKCMYTMTPDEDFIVDRHPKWNNFIIAAGFSGHGFKLAPVIGKILGQLAMNEQPSYDIAPMSMGRFVKGSSKL